MKKPTRHEKTALVPEVNINAVQEKVHVQKGALHSKSQTMYINPTLHELAVTASDERNVVLADIARMALQYYLENPDAAFNPEFLKDNTKSVNYKITDAMDTKITQFKETTGIVRSILFRRALSAWLIYERTKK